MTTKHRYPTSRWLLSGLIMILAVVIGAGGCGPGQRAQPPELTRTPQPTFTPVAEAPSNPAPAQQELAVPAATATPEAEPTPHVEGLVKLAAVYEPELEPTVVIVATPSSPAAADIPQTGRAILIDQDRQYMYVFEDGVEIRAIPCSTGDPARHSTKAWQGVVGDYVGTFFAFGVYADYAWYLFHDGGSILIHGAPYNIDEGGQRVYHDLGELGRRPVSRGCIRIHPDEAVWFTFWDPTGVPVIITPWTGGAPLEHAPDH